MLGSVKRKSALDMNRNNNLLKGQVQPAPAEEE